MPSLPYQVAGSRPAHCACSARGLVALILSRRSTAPGRADTHKGMAPPRVSDDTNPASQADERNALPAVGVMGTLNRRKKNLIKKQMRIQATAEALARGKSINKEQVLVLPSAAAICARAAARRARLARLPSSAPPAPHSITRTRGVIGITLPSTAQLGAGLPCPAALTPTALSRPPLVLSLPSLVTRII